jgi:hypothetical protein
MIHRFKDATKKNWEPPKPMPATSRRLIPFMKIRERRCKWPVTDDPSVIGYLFCGRATTGYDFAIIDAARALENLFAELAVLPLRR